MTRKHRMAAWAVFALEFVFFLFCYLGYIGSGNPLTLLLAIAFLYWCFEDADNLDFYRNYGKNRR